MADSVVRTFVGIDPGAHGAIARLTGTQLEIEDCPLLSTGKLDRIRLRDIISEHDYAAFTLIEDVHSMPRDGKASAFSFGANYSAWLQCLVCSHQDYRQIAPQEWKRKVGVTADKQSSVARCRALFRPDQFHLFYGPRGGIKDGRAEAALLAWLAQRTWKMEGRT